jgi:hypothetical protein
MNIKLNPETLSECLEYALDRVFRGKELSEQDRREWVKANHDKIVEGMEDAIEGICYRIENPVKVVTKPVLEFKTGERNTIRLWILDARERASLGEHRSFQFGGDETASLIYEEFGHGHHAIEYNINNESTWKWIQEWMEKGMKSENLLRVA